MRYQLTPINTRPWLLNGLSLRLIESHYEHNYGAALNRLNSVTGELEALDVKTTSAQAGHQSAESGADHAAQLHSAS